MMQTDKVLVLILYFIYLSFGGYCDFEWELAPREEVVPSPRGGAKLVATGLNLVYWGGFYECFNANGTCDHDWKTDLYHYSPFTGKWKLINPTSSTGSLPGPRAFFGARYYAGRAAVVVFGGVQYNVTLSYFHPYDEIWFYYPLTHHWELIQPNNAGPLGYIASNVEIIGHEMYVFGGLRPDFVISNELWKFNLITKMWTMLLDGTTNSPSPRYLATFEYNRRFRSILLEGGNIFPAASGAQTNTTWRYDVQQNEWTQEESMQLGRIHNAAGSYGRKVYLAFGDLENVGSSRGCRTPEASAGQKPTDEVWYYDMADDHWTQIYPTDGPGPLKRVASTVYANKLYVVGGYDYVCPNEELGYPIWNEEMWTMKLRF